MRDTTPQRSDCIKNTRDVEGIVIVVYRLVVGIYYHRREPIYAWKSSLVDARDYAHVVLNTTTVGWNSSRIVESVVASKKI